MNNLIVYKLIFNLLNILTLRLPYSCSSLVSDFIFMIYVINIFNTNSKSMDLASVASELWQ